MASAPSRCSVCSGRLQPGGERQVCADCSSLALGPRPHFDRRAAVAMALVWTALLEFAVLVLFNASIGRHVRALSLAWRGEHTSAAALALRPPQSDVLLEGRVSDKNRPLFQGLVAYRLAVAPNDSRAQLRFGQLAGWDRELDHGGELRIDLSDGPARTIRPRESSGLVLGGRLHILYVQSGLQARRYTGIRAGDPVLVFGALDADARGPFVRAERILVGDRAVFIKDWLDMFGARACCGALLLVLCPLVGLYVVRRLWTGASV